MSSRFGDTGLTTHFCLLKGYYVGDYFVVQEEAELS